MSYSNYPSGFANGVTINGVPLLQTNPGKVFWVNNSSAIAEGGIGGSNGNKGTYQQPFSTIDYAVGRCTASRGDIIFVMPGHNEGGTAAGLVTMDVAGVAIIGLGRGSLRPTLDYDDTDVTFVMSAADCTVHNLIFRASAADVVTGISVTAKGARIDGNEFSNEAAADNFIDFIETSAVANAADGLEVTNNKVYSTDVGNNGFVEFNEAITGFKMHGNTIALGVAAGESIIGYDTATFVSLDVDIQDNSFIRLNTSGPLLLEGTGNTCSGVIANNYIGTLDAAAPALVSTGSVIRHFNNYTAGAIDASGRLMPAVESTSDMRLKTNIRRLGQYMGFNIYTWDWNDVAVALGINDPTVGVLAQEVQHTGCVVERDGWLRVRYDQLFA